MVLHLYASGMSKDVEPPKTFGQIMKNIKDKKGGDSDNWMADKKTLSGLGMKVKKGAPKKDK